MTDIERMQMELVAAIGITRRLTAEVERLLADNERLRAALQDIAEDPYAVDGGAAEIARAALEPKP